ncbi:bromodomain containing protein [Nitzschia inconspicua]|uniref:Bromodomain containing protein n=1 Tax=Nitzschia inconspicua TaxID=303405 RepID=A0A9K3PYV8_9STRA|nr:bromodomain containing protein [Nitzschia inconspicua]
MWNGHPHHHPYYPQPPIHPGDPRYAAAMALQLQQQQQQQQQVAHYAYANGHQQQHHHHHHPSVTTTPSASMSLPQHGYANHDDLDDYHDSHSHTHRRHYNNDNNNKNHMTEDDDDDAQPSSFPKEDDEEDDDEEDDEEDDDEDDRSSLSSANEQNDDNNDNDSDGDNEKQFKAKFATTAAAAAAASPLPQSSLSKSSLSKSSPPVVLPLPQPRGKPEAMAAQLAFAVKEQQILEEQERQRDEAAAAAKKSATATMDIVEDDDDDDDDDDDNNNHHDTPLDSLVTHSTKVTTTTTTSTTPKMTVAPAASKKKKPTPSSTTTTTPNSKKKKTTTTTTTTTSAPKKKATPAKRSPAPAASKTSTVLASIDLSNLPTMDDPVEPITQVQYEKLKELMTHFCKVPLLAEFSRPVAVLHPELMSVYSKIVEHPIDLGLVCRRVRRRQYTNLRDVRLDTWRIFANCVKYHSHPNNKQAVPSFISIALHLKDLFNDLWQEHMLPSDYPPPPPSPGKNPTSKTNKRSTDPHGDLREAMDERAKDRKRRLVVSGLSIMNGSNLLSTATALDKFIDNGGRVDQLDVLPIWGEDATLTDDDASDMELVVQNLRKFATTLRELASQEEDMGVDELDAKMRKCYTDTDGLESMNPVLKLKIANRLGRFVGQLLVPINEANCRGVSQSSVWGCMAAAVWARESSKKPFWPALVLGILAPVDQSEEWHKALTERNEARLPEKLKTQLLAGKRKAEQAIKRQAAGLAEPQSFFLVEFLGTHEFIWVREADIVENFSPEDDPNKGDSDAGSSKKKRISRSNLNSILGSKMYASAIEEAQWALEEFEVQLQDIGMEPKEPARGEDDDRVPSAPAEEGYSFNVLSQSDDEAETEGDESPSSESLDIDECNELLATNGLLDFSTAGRKKRAQILKQHKLDAEKKKKAQKVKRERADKAKKVKDAKEKEKEKKQEQRDLEKKRRKRTREREKALKGIDHQKKKLRLSDPAPGRRHLIISKRERAEAIVDGYIDRTAKMAQYKTLSLGGGEEKWIPSAVIDSKNLCGMALAFRAAAGMIPMPNPVTTGPGKYIIRPWDSIHLKGKKKSEERCALLEKQIELVQKEIDIVNAQREKRLILLKDAKQAVAQMNDSIIANDKAARENPLKKAKKAHPLSGRKRSKSIDDDDEDEDTVESMDVVETTNEARNKEDDDALGQDDLNEESVVEVVVDDNEGQDEVESDKNDLEEDHMHDDQVAQNEPEATAAAVIDNATTATD